MNDNKINKKSLWKMDKQGNLVFPTRSGQLKATYASTSIWEHPIMAIVIMAAAAVMDYAVFKQLFAALLYDRAWLQVVGVCACLVAFDLGPIYLGILVKRDRQGLKIDWFTVAGLVFAFLLVFAGNIWLRITVKDVLIPKNTTSASSLFSAVGADSDQAALPYAIFSSLLPVATSFVSFVASCTAANPLLARIKRLHYQEVELEDRIVQVEAVLKEYNEDPDLYGRLMEEDDRMFETASTRANELGYLYVDYVRERIKEHLGDPAATNELSKDVRDRLESLLAALPDRRPELPEQPEPPEPTGETSEPDYSNTHLITTKEVA